MNEIHQNIQFSCYIGYFPQRVHFLIYETNICTPNNYFFFFKEKNIELLIKPPFLIVSIIFLCKVWG